MPIHQLSLESLRVLDLGKVDEAVRSQLTRVARDCMDRPGEAKSRKVSLVFTVSPVLEADGDCTQVRVQMHVTSDLPKLRTREYTMGLQRNGAIVFSEDDPADYSRPGLYEGQE